MNNTPSYTLTGYLLDSIIYPRGVFVKRFSKIFYSFEAKKEASSLAGNVIKLRKSKIVTGIK
jgi:hypothetical protein